MLSNDREMDGNTRVVSGQRLGKHVPIARQKILNNTKVGIQQRTTVFLMWSVPRCYKQGTSLESVSSVRGL
jgi:hypothetical protein